MTYAERVTPPKAFSCGDAELENALGPVRPLEIGDVLIDEKGGFYVVQAASDRLMRVTGDARMLQEAAYAFSSRGVRYAKTEDGFAMIENEQFRRMLTSVGLKTESVVAPFIPEALPEPEEEESCCCCGHHHHDGECGCHHHNHDNQCDCGCGHHHEMMRSAAADPITTMTVMINAAADAITTITTTSAGASTMSTTRGVAGITVK